MWYVPDCSSGLSSGRTQPAEGKMVVRGHESGGKEWTVQPAPCSRPVRTSPTDTSSALYAHGQHHKISQQMDNDHVQPIRHSSCDPNAHPSCCCWHLVRSTRPLSPTRLLKLPFLPWSSLPSLLPCRRPLPTDSPSGSVSTSEGPTRELARILCHLLLSADLSALSSASSAMPSSLT